MNYEIMKTIHSAIALVWVGSLVYLAVTIRQRGVAIAVGTNGEKGYSWEQLAYRAVATPAMVVVLFLGFVLARQTGAWSTGWFNFKVMHVVALSGVHGFIGHLIRAERLIRANIAWMLAALPPFMATVIIYLVVAKPF